jgi:hypothetical protein
MNFRYLLDPTLGNTARRLIVKVTGLLTIAGLLIDRLEAAQWTISLPVILAFLADTRLGNTPRNPRS